MVNEPPHYKTGGIDTLDYIMAKKLEYCVGNVVKYVSRAKHKGNELQDLKKAEYYLKRSIKELKEKQKTFIEEKKKVLESVDIELKSLKKINEQKM